MGKRGPNSPLSCREDWVVEEQASSGRIVCRALQARASSAVAQGSSLLSTLVSISILLDLMASHLWNARTARRIYDISRIGVVDRHIVDTISRRDIFSQ